MVSNSTGIYLGPASSWSTKDGESVRSEETAQKFPIRNVDHQDIGIGYVTRQRNQWTFKIFGREDIPVRRYNTKEEALAGARNSL
jgi:hypothetical protein